MRVNSWTWNRPSPLIGGPVSEGQPLLPAVKPVRFANEQEKPRCPDVCQLPMAGQLISCFNQSSKREGKFRDHSSSVSPGAPILESPFPGLAKKKKKKPTPKQKRQFPRSARNAFHLLLGGKCWWLPPPQVRGAPPLADEREAHLPHSSA